MRRLGVSQTILVLNASSRDKTYCSIFRVMRMNSGCLDSRLSVPVKLFKHVESRGTF